MKDNVNDELPNGIPKNWIPSNGVVNQGGKLNCGVEIK